jgi:hypothetical protein
MVSKQSAWLSTVVLFVFSFAASATECDETIGRIVAQVPKLTLERETRLPDQSYQTANFLHPVGTVGISCKAPMGSWVSVYHDGAATPAFFDVVAAVGSALTGVQVATVREGSIGCQKKALKREFGEAEHEHGGLLSECSHSRDGGSSQAVRWAGKE